MFTSRKLFLIILKNSIISLLMIMITFTAIFFIKKEIEKISNAVVLNKKLKYELQKRTELFSILEKDASLVGKNDLVIMDAFIPSNNISSFIEKLDTLDETINSKQAYRFETPVIFGNSEVIPISMISYSNNLSANINDFYNYLKSFENIPYFTKIDSFSISSQDKTGWLTPSSISIKATLFTKTIN